MYVSLENGKKAKATLGYHFFRDITLLKIKIFPSEIILYMEVMKSMKIKRSRGTLSIKPFFSKTSNNLDTKMGKRDISQWKNIEARGFPMIQMVSQVEEVGVDAKGIPLIICGFKGILGIASA